MGKKSKRSAKLLNSSPASTAMHEAKGPFQGQSVESTAAQLETKTRVSSDDESSSEDEQVEVETSDSEQVTAEAAGSSNPVAARSEVVEGSSKQDEEKSVAEKADEVIAEVSSLKIVEVVVVGAMRYMPVEEIAEEAKARSARRINRRVDGELQPTTAVVLRFVDDPPEYVIIHQERFWTRSLCASDVKMLQLPGLQSPASEVQEASTMRQV